jgi:cell fate regulator YaaT (PSP1 superfamily)
MANTLPALAAPFAPGFDLNMPKYVVRSGVMRALGVFSTGRDETFQRGVEVVVRTDRGLEVGEVLCEATEAAISQIKDPGHGQILRTMTADDARERSRLFDQARQEYQTSLRLIEQEKLEMRLVDVEHLFGGERVVVYYLAENRVDFRELVRQLAGEFQTRVEMRQIGVRDEAKILADYGDCGKPVCCNTHLSEMPPVSMKMAKIQKATLDPTKISGRCGRLKCCLRYEYDTYDALQKELPPLGSDVITARGRCRVLAQEILAGQLLVETEDHRRVLIDAGEVMTVLKRGASPERGVSEESS